MKAIIQRSPDIKNMLCKNDKTKDNKKVLVNHSQSKI